MIDQRLIKLAKNMGSDLLFVILVGSLSGILIITQCFLVAKIVNNVFLNGQGMTELSPNLLMLLSVILFRAFFFWVGEILAQRGGIKIQTKLRQALLAKIFALGPVAGRQQDTGQLISTIINSVDALESFFARYLPALALAGIIPLGILMVTFPRDLLTAIIFLFTAPLIPLFMILIGNLADKWANRQWHILGKMNSHFLDVLEGLTTLKLLQRNMNQTKIISRLSKEWAKATMGVLRIAFLSAFFLEFFMTISTALIAVSLGLRLITGSIDFQIAFFLLLLAPEFYGPLRKLGVQYHAGVSASKAVEDIFNLLSLPLSENQNEGLVIDKEAFEKGLVFENVSFSYEGDRQALNKINLRIQKGEKLALVGSSGAGKSTLLQLIMGFAHPQAGRILIGEIPLRDINLESLRRQIAFVPQKPHLFHGTVAENIAFGKPLANLFEIKEAAKNAGIHQSIMELPKGYETIIGDGGRSLSSGQRQLIALTRAFLLDAPLVLLDEATASLDLESEEAIQNALIKLLEGRTVLVAAHRLATLSHMNRIIVLECGKLVETGSHKELLMKRGFYHRLLTNYRGDLKGERI